MRDTSALVKVSRKTMKILADHIVRNGADADRVFLRTGDGGLVRAFGLAGLCPLRDTA